MDILKSSSNNILNTEDNTRLLFYENYKNEKNQYNIEEIFFSKPIFLQQIRILKADSNPHTKIKSNQRYLNFFIKSITQTQPIYNFEIFARNLRKYADKFECIFESATINEKNGTTDCIFPIFSELMTNHIVFRGMYERISLCIYGVPFTGNESHMLLEFAKADVPLDKLHYEESSKEDKQILTNDDMQLINAFPIDSLVSPYIKCDLTDNLKRSYYINPPDMNMIEKTKTGYIYYENDLIYYSQCIYNFYLNENKSKKNYANRFTINMPQSSQKEDYDNEVGFQGLFKKTLNILQILIAKNFAFLEEESVFRSENFEIFRKIPEVLVEITVNALQGRLFGYSEIKLGLKLLKMLTNSSQLVNVFVEQNGMECLYSLLIRKDSEQVDGESRPSQFAGEEDYTTSAYLKARVLESIYRLISHSKAFSRFIDNIDKSKFPQQYFMIKEVTKDGHDDYERDDSSAKGRNSERDRKRSKKKRRRSRSRTNSRERTYSRETDSPEYRKIKRKNKNVPLKNGYQIILTLIIGKKNNLISNIVKKIINKASLILYMKEIGNFIESITTMSVQ